MWNTLECRGAKRSPLSLPTSLRVMHNPSLRRTFDSAMLHFMQKTSVISAPHQQSPEYLLSSPI
ncbi:hypothetical protein M405DRAFT_821036 [Rhizopogon salebrosus TDB-379]|nr:hypothetical protein M405DRAFT_821036 [Rhizopogon salebrosus TDB-379]